jgi:tRNA threonylcarbamoyladenosine biosynthesis protein TsaB
MLILIIRTDKPQAEIGLYQDAEKLSYYTWEAHRQLAETIHLKIKEQLADYGKQIHDLNAIAVYKGPGSFTGLRIGISVANALAESLSVPIIGMTGNEWVMHAITHLLTGENEKIIMPEYGAPVHITLPKR